MRKWLPLFLAMASVAAFPSLGQSFTAMAGEENTQDEQAEEFSPYISLDELQDLTPVYAETDLDTQNKNAAEEAAEAAKIEGKTEAEMSDAERKGARFLWEDQLYGKSFVLDSMDGKPLASPRPVSLQFSEDGTISGRICNTFHGKTEFTGMIFKAPEVATTRMMCPDKELANLEKEFLKNLGLGIGYSYLGDDLELRRDSMVLIFRPEGAASRSAPKAAEAPATPRPAPAPEAVKPAPAPVKPAPVAPAPVAPAPAPVVVTPPPAVVAPVAPAPVAPPPAVVTRPAPVAPPAASLVPPSDPVEPIGDIGEKDLAGRRFVLTQVDGETFTPDMGEQPYIQFDQGLGVSGKACNTFRGPGVLQDDILTVANAASTMMMCVDAKLNKYEKDLYRLLREGMQVDLNGKQLILSGDGREFVYNEY